MLKIDNVTFEYDKQTVIKDLSYEFKYRAVTAITGASGSGKTTLLYLLSGLSKANKGNIINDHKKIAVVFQEPRLLPWLSALENVTVTGADQAQAKRLIAALFPNEDVSKKYPDELSGGMKQRIAIARALAYDPDLLLLDEAFKGLDAKTRALTADIVFNEIKGKTCILITHDESDLKYCEEHVNIASTPISKFVLVKSSSTETE